MHSACIPLVATASQPLVCEAALSEQCWAHSHVWRIIPLLIGVQPYSAALTPNRRGVAALAAEGKIGEGSVGSTLEFPAAATTLGHVCVAPCLFYLSRRPRMLSSLPALAFPALLQSSDSSCSLFSLPPSLPSRLLFYLDGARDNCDVERRGVVQCGS